LAYNAEGEEKLQFSLLEFEICKVVSRASTTGHWTCRNGFFLIIIGFWLIMQRGKKSYNFLY